MNEIEKVQDETNVKNYFPFLQFLKSIKILLNKEFNSDNPDFALIDSLMGYFEEVIKKLYLSFEWCKDNNFQAYALDKKLCQLDKETDDFGKIKLFVASSFILPLNYKELEIEIDNINDSFNEFRNHIPLFKRLLAESIKIKNTEIEIEKRDRNQIEILGIFAAIVLFAAGGINIFKESPSIQESAKFSLIFSYSLSIFVILIWLVTRDKNNFKPSLLHYVIVTILLFSTYTIFAISFSFWPFNLDLMG